MSFVYFVYVCLYFRFSVISTRAPTFRLQAVRLLTTRLQQFVSTTIRLHYNTSTLQFVSTTIRFHYNSSPLLFVSTQLVSNNSSPLLLVPLLFVSRQFVSLRFVSNNLFPLLFVSTTIRLHYFSSPQNSSPTICLHYYLSPLIFGSITILLYIV